MAWTDEDQHLTRTREELLSRVTRRGEELRRRHRGGRVVATISAVLVVAAVAGIGITGDGDPAVQVATGGPSTTTGGEAWVEPVPGAAGEFPTSTSTPGPAPMATPGSVSAPPSSLPPTTVTAASAAPTSTAAPPTTGRTASPTTSTSQAPDKPKCTTAQLEMTANPEKPEFRPGEVVRIPTTIRNRTSAPCYYNGFTLSYEVKNAAGQGLGGGAHHADTFRDVALEAGQTLTENADWNPQDCTGGPGTCMQAAPGDYTANLRWSLADLPIQATVSFRLVP